jgi:iron complex outermembrane receptor protein
MKKITLSLIGASILVNLHANEVVLKPLEVVSTAIKTDELRATDAIEVYTQKDIEKSHAKDIYEFLNKETSVITLPSYGNSFTQKIDLRGYGYENGYQNIVIKVNGRKLNNVDMVPQLLSSISPNQVERIEIIKSSGIVEAGDGANGGVINIITKESNEVTIGAYAGIYNTFDGNFYAGHSDDKLSISVSGEAQKNGGIRNIDDNGNKDSSKYSNFAFEMSYIPIDEIELRLNAQTSNIDTWYAGSLTKQEYDENIYQKGDSNYGATNQLYTSDVVGGGVSYYINDKLSINGDFSHEYKTSEYPAFSYMAKYVYNSYNVNLAYEDSALKIKVGLDGFNGDRRQTSNVTSKDNLAGYMLAEYRVGNNSFKAGYRYEKVSYEYSPTNEASLDDDESLSGIEVGYNYTLNNEQSLFINYSHSYQAPDIDRFFATTYPPPNYTPVVNFNGFINPQKANNYTLGYNYITKSNKLKLAIWYIDLKDEIYYHKTSAYAGVNTNIDQSYKYGFDLYDKYIVNQEFNLMLNYNYVMAKIDKEVDNGVDFSGKELPGVSNHNVKAVLNYLPNKNTTFSLTQVYRSKAYAANDFANNFSQKQDAYYSTDISATYAKKTWEVFAKVNNIFNQKNGIWIKDDTIYPVNYTTTAYVGLKLKY